MSETQTETVQELAREAARWFEVARRATGDTETGPREDGERYVRVKDGAPEWVTELVHEAHGDMFPDDWRYETIADAVQAIADADDVDDARDDFADSAVDVYTWDRFAWLSSHLSRAGYVDEATENFGPADGVVEAIGRGQYVEADEVFGLVVQFLEQRADELEGGEEEAQ